MRAVSRDPRLLHQHRTCIWLDLLQQSRRQRTLWATLWDGIMESIKLQSTCTTFLMVALER